MFKARINRKPTVKPLDLPFLAEPVPKNRWDTPPVKGSKAPTFRLDKLEQNQKLKDLELSDVRNQCAAESSGGDGELGCAPAWGTG